MGLQFESPFGLLLFAAIPAAWLVLRYSLVDAPRARLAASAAVRSCILALLVLSVSGAVWVSRGTLVSVMVLADLSDSVAQDAREQVLGFLAQLESRLPGSARAGLATFAATATIYQGVERHPSFPRGLALPEERGETSIERALLLAGHTLPADTVNRAVLFTDGNETSGDARAAAGRLAAHGLKVFPIAYHAKDRDEILLEDLEVPAEVKKGQSFSVRARAHSTVATKGLVTLYRDGFKVQQKTVEFEQGKNTLSFEELNPPDGLSKYELRIKTDNDFFADNNVSSGVVFASGEPRVLLLEGEEREARHLTRALEAESIRVEVRESRGMPATLDELAAFDAVIFSDVAATDVSTAQMESLRSYIEDLGGGFIMIGGRESFGLGGYYRTSIEKALPVRMRSERQKDTPSLAMAIVVDRSGSMSGQKIELAKEAAIAAVELLGERDYVGVIAFDNQPYWVVDMQNAANESAIVQAVESIGAGGGTNLYPAIELAHEALAGTSAALKHTIVLTDGQSQPGDFPGIVDAMVLDRITVSAVAVGDGADVNLLQDIAQRGHGRYYFTADPYDVPQIFTKETMAASKSALVEEPFLPKVFQTDPVILGIDWDTAPFLFGYVVTTAKPTAKVSLATERGDPLLASWQFGLGKCVAFTSDAKSRWASDWLNWSGYGKFWAQLVRSTVRTSRSNGSDMRIEVGGNVGTIRIDNIDENGNFINGLVTTAQVINPALKTQTLTLPQTAPGRYETTVPIRNVGSYLFKVRQAVPATEQKEEQVVSEFTRGVTISYRPEYRHLSTNEHFLRELADATGGRVNPTIDELLSVSDDEAVSVRHKLWPWLIAAALVLFVIDVALRRLELAGWRLFRP